MRWKWVTTPLYWLKNNLTPPSSFSWHTLILLSVFSWAMSALATDESFVDVLLSNFGWLFLIAGVYWGTTSCAKLWLFRNPKAKKEGLPLSPWITGALVSIYLFSRATDGVSIAALVYWPIISAIIAALPLVLGEGLTPKMPEPDKRKGLILLITSQLLLSCWLQFYVIIQGWLTAYPSIAAEDFHRSAFVVKLPSLEAEPFRQRIVRPRGIAILNTMEPLLEQQLNGRAWSEVERLLLPEARLQFISRLGEAAKQRLIEEQQQALAEGKTVAIKEDNLWQIGAGISQRESGYNLELRANWLGPRSQPQALSLTKECQIVQVNAVANVECQDVKGWGINQPIVAQN